MIFFSLGANFPQIFLKGLTARMDSWPTLVLGTSLGMIKKHLAQDLLLTATLKYRDAMGFTWISKVAWCHLVGPWQLLR